MAHSEARREHRLISINMEEREGGREGGDCDELND